MQSMFCLLLFARSYTIVSVALAACGGFIVGVLIKYGYILKQKKKILKLEDEMLSNHAQILSLSKKLSDLKNPTPPPSDPVEMKGDKKSGLRAS